MSNPEILTAIAIMLITAIAGFLVAQSKWNSPTFSRIVIGISAGIMLAIVSVEFLPHAFEGAQHFAGVLLLAGVIVNLFFDLYVTPHLSFLDNMALGNGHSHDDHCQSPQHEHHHQFISSHGACSVVGCLAICSLFDGFQINAAYAIGMETGMLMSAGMLMHILPDGILAATIIMAGNLSRPLVYLSILAVSSFVVIGTLLGQLLQVSYLSQSQMMAFSSGILLYVVFVHLLPGVGKSKSAQISLMTSIVLFGAILLSHAH